MPLALVTPVTVHTVSGALGLFAEYRCLEQVGQLRVEAL